MADKINVKDILEKYNNDPEAIEQAIYDHLKEKGIAYIKPLDSGLFEIYDGKGATKIADQKYVDKLVKEQLKPNDNSKGDSGLNELDGSETDNPNTDLS